MGGEKGRGKGRWEGVWGGVIVTVHVCHKEQVTVESPF